MDFKETYKKYLDGTATDEEKAFVESEIERARLVNSEVIAATKVSETKPQETKKKKSFRHTLKTIIISVVVFVIASLITFATFYSIIFSNALDNIKVKPEEAKAAALEEAYKEAKYHYGYNGPMEMLVAEQELDTRELVFKIPLSKCHYVYEFEFVAGNVEIDVQVNSATGNCVITGIDKLD